MNPRFLMPALGAALLSTVASSARAAESLDTCTGTIASIPAVISTQGTWCLDHDLASAATGITAIEIKTNNVTIDCNHLKIGNVAAGVGTFSTAISASDRSNITVRNCAIRGFRNGIFLGGAGGGHLVEDNRLEFVTSTGMYIVGPTPSLVQRNHVIDTGGAPGSDRASAILVLGDAIDNIVDGVSGADDVADFSASGIYAGGFGGDYAIGILIRGNRVRDMIPKGTGSARGISNSGYGMVMRENQVANYNAVTGQGLYCSTGGVMVDNQVYNYSIPFTTCSDGGGNTTW